MALETPNEQEIKEVTDFLQKKKGKWVTNRQMLRACPSLKQYRDDDEEPLVYVINTVCQNANIKGGVEEHGYEDYLVF